jgi:DNA recombination protein RmuC
MELGLLLFLVVINGGVLFLVWKSSEETKNEKVFQRLIERMNDLESRLDNTVRSEVRQNRQEMAMANRDSRSELSSHLEKFREQLGSLTEKNEHRMEAVRKIVEERLMMLQKDNAEKLEKMRLTVDEKLHETLEKRLEASFSKVQNQLESVHKGLGEMQTLASGVGDLKKVLQNVKTRGTWGEVQLGNLLSDILTQEQYETNVVTKKGSADRVEFAINIPSKDEDGKYVLLPLDAKFPLEDYQLLIDASEKGDVLLIEQYSKQLENRIKGEAKDIRDKYLDPPQTTDFAILFLPNEGLYAEVLRRVGLADLLRKEYRVVVAGPMTIAALLNSLQMGFRTLAIQKRSSEVWGVLSNIQKNFSQFGVLLDKTQKKLQEASNHIEKASSKSRNIERKLGRVQDLPEGEAEDIAKIEIP